MESLALACIFVVLALGGGIIAGLLATLPRKRGPE